MNIGIITYHRAENYGSALQAYALNKTIQLLNKNYKVETIDYSNSIQQAIYKIFHPIHGIMDIARNFHSLIYYRSLQKKKTRFQSFINQYIPLSNFNGSDKKRLKEYASKYDIVICGSDQIWNIHCWDFDESYMLDFVNSPTIKISYAPSLGLSSFSDRESMLYKKYLHDFSFISVREQQGADFLKCILNRDIKVVLDPVFLLSAKQWNDIATNAASMSLPSQYILCYFIGEISGMRKFAKRLSKQTNLPIILIIKNLRDIFSFNKTRFSAGPLEFIHLILNAKYVVTDSFHAVSFSLLFHKIFWVFTANGIEGEKKPNARIEHILSLSNLNDRNMNVSNYMNKINLDLNFQYSDTIIEKYRNDSLEYLKQALNF